VFDFRAHFCHSAPKETHAFGFRLPANAPEGQKRFPISSPKAISYQSVSTALRDELGLEYLRQTVANDVDEANVLQAFGDNNSERLAKTSHNLKSVSDLIGMQETSALAAKIQDDCLNWRHDGLKDTVEKLQQVAANESQEVRKIASTCQRGDA
jgi:HPt (histidine-containing phosphotransfer) domain-containing protein